MYWNWTSVESFLTKVVKFLVWAYFVKNKVHDNPTALVKANVFL